MAENLSESAIRREPIEIAVSLRQKLNTFQHRLEKIAALQSEVSPDVYHKVRSDYQEKYDKIQRDFDAVAEQAMKRKNKLESMLEDKEGALLRLTEQWEEVYLRAEAGQYNETQRTQVYDKYVAEKGKLEEVIMACKQLLNLMDKPSVKTDEYRADDHRATDAMDSTAISEALNRTESAAEAEDADMTAPKANDAPMPSAQEEVRSVSDDDEPPIDVDAAEEDTVEEERVEEAPMFEDRAEEKTESVSEEAEEEGETRGGVKLNAQVGDTMFQPIPDEIREEPSGSSGSQQQVEGQYTRMQKLADLFGTDDISALSDFDSPPADSGKKLPVLIFHSGNLKGERVHISENRLSLGRVRDNTVQIENDTSVSRYHAEISRMGADFILKDLNSSNGTLLNGKPIKASVTLKNGDLVTIGECEIVYISDPQDPRAEE